MEGKFPLVMSMCWLVAWVVQGGGHRQNCWAEVGEGWDNLCGYLLEDDNEASAWPPFDSHGFLLGGGDRLSSSSAGVISRAGLGGQDVFQWRVEGWWDVTGITDPTTQTPNANDLVIDAGLTQLRVRRGGHTIHELCMAILQRTGDGTIRMPGPTFPLTGNALSAPLGIRATSAMATLAPFCSEGSTPLPLPDGVLRVGIWPIDPLGAMQGTVDMVEVNRGLEGTVDNVEASASVVGASGCTSSPTSYCCSMVSNHGWPGNGFKGGEEGVMPIREWNSRHAEVFHPTDVLVHANEQLFCLFQPTQVDDQCSKMVRMQSTASWSANGKGSGRWITGCLVPQTLLAICIQWIH
ncbi:hypothetical protein EDD16DRAFT_1527380 [Pisolithus croceorrhizus]|nr:hypothetical protein EDD16DRAFT_1527380 [Pisolithus croceorrhizus]